MEVLQVFGSVLLLFVLHRGFSSWPFSPFLPLGGLWVISWRSSSKLLNIFSFQYPAWSFRRWDLSTLHPDQTNFPQRLPLCPPIRSVLTNLCAPGGKRQSQQGNKVFAFHLGRQKKTINLLWKYRAKRRGGGEGVCSGETFMWLQNKPSSDVRRRWCNLDN